MKNVHPKVPDFCEMQKNSPSNKHYALFMKEIDKTKYTTHIHIVQKKFSALNIKKKTF